MRRIGVFLLFFCFSITLLNAQKRKSDSEKNQIIENRVEFLLENSEETEEDYITLLDRFLYFYEHPINLNTAGKQDLQDLSLLTEIQINYLLEHIRLHGKLMALEELQTVQGFDVATIQLIRPFVKVNYDIDQIRIRFDELLKNGKHTFFVRSQQILEEQEGYKPIDDSLLSAKPNSRYLGSNIRLYTRYRYTFGNTLSIGLTAEKDAGEEFFKGTQANGFDFYSAHFFMRNRGKMKQLALGDFQAQFGQGLTLWSGLAFSKGADILMIKRNATALLPYSSVDENRFLRGAGTTWQFGHFHVTGFYSSKHFDATVFTESDTSFSEREVTTITAFQQSGFHRTPNEIKGRNSVLRSDMGGHVAFKRKSLELGLTALHSRFNSEYKPKLSYYNRFNLDTNRLSNLGIDYNYIYKNINFFGEAAHSINGGFAQTHGAIMMLDPRLTFSVLYRNFQRNYQSLLSNAISENTLPANEQGLYMGFKAQLSKAYTLTAYYDNYRFPWLKYLVNAPSSGYEYMAQVNYTPSKKLDMYVRVRERMRNRNSGLPETNIVSPVAQQQLNYRYHITFKASENIKLASRIEYITYRLGQHEKDEQGFMCYQDIVYQSLKSPWVFTFRYALFDTDSYDSRIYAYENDVLYAFSIPAYYYRGNRTYLIVKFGGIRNVDMWVRVAQTFYNNRDIIGSGLDEIEGNTRTEVKVQVRINF